MKIRKGFVSNSSSSSFILKTEEDAKKFKERKKDIFSIKEILDSQTDREDMTKKLKETFPIAKIMFREYDSVYSITEELFSEYERLKEFYDKGYLYVTEPMDRDWAYTMGFDRHELWDGDL